uniref:LCP family protein n=1 Tax=Dorea sp. TaxID=2040332 RepID=UPI003FF0C626
MGKKIGAILGGTLVTVAAIGAVIVASKLSKINTVKLDTDKLSVSKEAKKRGSGYLNVALFGVDSRDNDLDKGTRSDTIMIASLNKKTMKVKIASIYRDTLSEQEDGTLNKINAAYSYGGPEGALSVLNKNLDMNIEHYVTVNFNSMIDIVDSVGGIDIDVQEDEMPYICGYVQEIMKVTGKLSPGVTEPGTQTLNGVQATAYARIRYTAGDDFRRAERQRAVLQKVVEKLQQASPAQLNKIIDKVFPEVSTNFTMTEILEYAKDAFDYELGETTGFPFDKTTDTLGNVGSVVIPVTMESNVKQLHSFFYGESDNYDVSSTVSGISAKIEKKAGNRDADTDESTQEFMQQPEETYSGNSGTTKNSSGSTGTTGSTSYRSGTSGNSGTSGSTGTTGSTTGSTTGTSTGSGTSTGTGSGTTGSTGTTGNGTSTGDTSTGTGGESTGGEGTTE